MVILLGGSSHVGKTLVAQRLMERIGFPYISLDHFKMGFIRSGMTTLTVNDDWKMRYWMWPFVAEIVKTAIENHQNLIVEGCYIPHNWKDSFTAQFDSPKPYDSIPPTTNNPESGICSTDYMSNIRSAFIVMSRSYIEQHFDLIKDYANIIEKRLDDSGLDMERLVMCSEGFKEDCIANGSPIVEIGENEDETYDVDSLVSRVLKALEL